jgi:hypothetical protein
VHAFVCCCCWMVESPGDYQSPSAQLHMHCCAPLPNRQLAVAVLYGYHLRFHCSEPGRLSYIPSYKQAQSSLLPVLLTSGRSSVRRQPVCTSTPSRSWLNVQASLATVQDHIVLDWLGQQLTSGLMGPKMPCWQSRNELWSVSLLAPVSR